MSDPKPTRPDPVFGHEDAADADRPAWLDMGTLRYEKRESFVCGLALGFALSGVGFIALSLAWL